MRAPVLCLAAAVGAFLAGHPAGAATAFVPPEGCQVDYTVQLRGCRVENHYRCAADPAGERRISIADQTGEFYVSRIDDETRWVASAAPQDGMFTALDSAGSADNASFSTLLATGRDDYDFVTRALGGETRRYIGHDRLTGESVTVSGQVLERTEFSMQIEDGDGTPLATRSGRQLISRGLRVFFGDAESFVTAEGERSDDISTPVSFAFPGQDGFSAAKPIFDCDMMMSLMSPNPHHSTL